ncbi:hypothetical protein ACFSN5_01125 [Streptococcus tangpeifui]|uniref:hypothetical protein n=1 Tax=Streptococcus tangpeifui TaxID=2709400 RepID=UPI0013EA8B89|nr:hypothetical protein [Streptococcus sp. ZJ1593]
MIYFDEAVILGDIAQFEVEVAFVNMAHYILRDWSVVCKVSSPFNSISLPSQRSEGSKILKWTGSVAFDSLDIFS